MMNGVRGPARITFISASDVLAADLNGKSDPYLLWRFDKDLKMGPLHGKSVVCEKTLNPGAPI